MKWIFYNALFALVYPFLLPGFLLRMLRRGGYAKRFGDRFALYPAGLFGANRPLFDSHGAGQRSEVRGQTAESSFIWIHAVSVGEVQVAGQLMREWRKADPAVRFCFSTTSSTGWMMALKELEEGQRSKVKGQTEKLAHHCLTSDLEPLTSSHDVLIYNPLDFPNFVKSALRTVRPRAIVLTESEIWPNFILEAKRMGIPLYLINARVSDRSAPRYRLARWFFKDVLSCFTRIFTQSDLDKARLVAAGAPEAIVDVTGSFKFDVAHRNEAKEQELREWIFGEDEVKGIGQGQERRAKILLGGSTWPGEDEVLLKIYKKILNLGLQPQPILVLAPRHFEKADAVEENIRKAGFACVRRSRDLAQKLASHAATGMSLPHEEQPETGQGNSCRCYLADTTGELMGLYGIADVVFVGKSLCAHGSQNMIEPCLCGKPTLVGPYTENFRPVMSDLLAAEAIIQVKDADELEQKTLSLFGTSAALGQRAAEAVARRRGVVAKCVLSIINTLSARGSRAVRECETTSSNQKEKEK